MTKKEKILIIILAPIFIISGFTKYGIGFVLLLLLLAIFLIYSYFEKKQKFQAQGIKYATSIFDLSSYPNLNFQKNGYQWSTVNELKKFSKKDIFLDKFAFYPMNDSLKWRDPNVKIEQDIFLDKLDFTKTMTVLGSMGSGKTEFFHSILNQRPFAQRNIIHDVKGDFVEKHYKHGDYIFNPYDQRGFYWDLWAEMKNNEAYIESFINNILQSQVEEKDFFTSSAKKILIEIFMKVHHLNYEKSSFAKWKLLNEEISEYEKKGNDDKTASSIYTTMELVIDMFKFFEYQSNLKNIQTFTISNFLQSNKTLFLLNNASISKKLNPLFTGFTAMLAEQLLSKADTKTDLTLFLLDEYLSLNFDKQTRNKLMTQMRSKGGCLMLGMQYLPKSDKEHQQLLDSSSYATLIFKLNDNETVKHMIDKLDENEYIAIVDYKKETKKSKFITTEHIQSMPNYHHLTLLLSEKIIYLGYTPILSDLSVKNANFVKAELKDFYDYKYCNHKKQFSEQEINDIANLYANAKSDDIAKILNKYNITKDELLDLFKD